MASCVSIFWRAGRVMGDSFFKSFYDRFILGDREKDSVKPFSGQSKGASGPFDLMALGPDSEIRLEERGALGIVTLNRPERLNALTPEGVRLFSAALEHWRVRKGVQAIVVVGRGRAFSVGGDMKNIYAAALAARNGQGSPETASVFFGEEYLLARQLYHYEKPVLFFLNGLAVGHLLGLAGPRLYRIATERTVFAVPHCALGFFPDCGSAYALNACPGRLGYYAALTGLRMHAAELLAVRLASHYLHSSHIEPTIAQLGAQLEGVRDPSEADRVVARLLSTSLDLPETGNALQNVAFIIDEHFSKPTLAEIRQSLARSGSGWARDTLGTLSSRCPFSLEVTVEHLVRSESLSFDAVLERDYALARSLALRDDFIEGVRAVLIDKDNAPAWSPPTPEAVDPQEVAACFRPQGRTLSGLT